jgi:hypothetical protein
MCVRLFIRSHAWTTVVKMIPLQMLSFVLSQGFVECLSFHIINSIQGLNYSYHVEDVARLTKYIFDLNSIAISSWTKNGHFDTHHQYLTKYVEIVLANSSPYSQSLIFMHLNHLYYVYVLSSVFEYKVFKVNLTVFMLTMPSYYETNLLSSYWLQSCNSRCFDIPDISTMHQASAYQPNFVFIEFYVNQIYRFQIWDYFG